METPSNTSRWLTAAVAVLVGLPLLLAACDTVSPPEDITIQGSVTTAAGYDTDETRDAGVEGAVVTAGAITATGQVLPLSGQATTNAEGRYSLNTESSTQAIRLRADGDGFNASVMLESGATLDVTTDGAIQAPPMNVESTAETEVYTASRTEAPTVTVADVSARVSARTAASINGGTVNAAGAARTAGAGTVAERVYARHSDGGGASSEQADQARQERRRAYAQFRSEISAATTQTQRRAAVNTFLSAYANAFATTGISATRQAEASMAGSGAAVRLAAGADSDARFATSHRARVLAGIAAALAVEEEFQLAGASDGRLNVLAQARLASTTALRAAATADEMASAFASYRSTVRTELAAEINVSPAAIDAAFAATAAARTALEAALAAAGTAEAAAAAYLVFFAAARQAVHAELGADATLAANVIAVLSAF